MKYKINTNNTKTIKPLLTGNAPTIIDNFEWEGPVLTREGIKNLRVKTEYDKIISVEELKGSFKQKYLLMPAIFDHYVNLTPEHSIINETYHLLMTGVIKAITTLNTNQSLIPLIPIKKPLEAEQNEITMINKNLEQLISETKSNKIIINNYGIKRIISIAQEYPDKELILRTTINKNVNKIIEAKKQASNIKIEIDYHNIIFNKSTRCVLPTKSKEEIKELIAIINKGLIDYLSSNHTPITREQKLRGKKGIPSYDAGAIGWLINQNQEADYLNNLLRAYTLREWEIIKGNPVKMIIINRKELWVTEDDNPTIGRTISPWVGKELPRLTALINNYQLISNPVPHP